MGYCKICKKMVGGRISTASDTAFCDRRGIARANDTVLAFCGHTGRIVIDSGKSFVNKRYIAAMGDRFDGDYVGLLDHGSDKCLIGE